MDKEEQKKLDEEAEFKNQLLDLEEEFRRKVKELNKASLNKLED